MDEKTNVVLIGMPAVGKSTVGVLLAKALGYSFVDTDILIQAGEGRTLQGIIDTEGLKFFREVEERYVCDLECERHVIATGGSVVYSQKAMDHLAATSVAIHLDIDLASLKQRLSDIKSRGVVIEPGQTIDDLYEKRRTLYLKYGDILIDCQGLTPGQVVEKVMEALQE